MNDDIAPSGGKMRAELYSAIGYRLFRELKRRLGGGGAISAALRNNDQRVFRVINAVDHVSLQKRVNELRGMKANRHNINLIAFDGVTAAFRRAGWSDAHG